MIKLAHGWRIRDFDHSVLNLWAGPSDFPHFGSSKALAKLVWLFMLLFEILVPSEYYVVFTDACIAFLVWGISSERPSLKSLTSRYSLWLEQDQILFFYTSNSLYLPSVFSVDWTPPIFWVFSQRSFIPALIILFWTVFSPSCFPDHFSSLSRWVWIIIFLSSVFTAFPSLVSRAHLISLLCSIKITNENSD